jgi:hypothetical protein
MNASFHSSLRAQASVEWLMLGLLALALLAIAAMAVSRAQTAQTTLAERRILQMEVREMAYYADQICVLGAGNSQVLELAPPAIHLEYDAGAHGLAVWKKARNGTETRCADGSMAAYCGEDAQFAKTLCAIEVNPADGYGTRAYLYYEAGSNPPIVRISNQPPS